jgi:hypothetical protein
MLLEIECSDTQPGDFQRLIFIPLFFSDSQKKTKPHQLMNLRRYDPRSTNTKNTQGNAQRLPSQKRPTATRTQIPRIPGSPTCSNEDVSDIGLVLFDPAVILVC